MEEKMTREVGMVSLSPLIEEILQGGGTVELTVTGNSMWPMLCHGVSRVRLAPIHTLKKGDLPLYRRQNGAYVLHRILAIRSGGSYTCCGDHQWQLEEGLERAQMLAVVTDFCRKGDQWVSVKDRKYRLYTRVWMAVRPLRRFIFAAWRRWRALRKSLHK